MSFSSPFHNENGKWRVVNLTVDIWLKCVINAWADLNLVCDECLKNAANKICLDFARDIFSHYTQFFLNFFLQVLGKY